MLNKTINDVNNFTENTASTTVDAEKGHANIQDQQAFEEMLTSDTIPEGSLGGKIMNGFMQVSNNMQYYKNAANASIKKASTNPELQNILDMMHRMHTNSKEVTITSRLVNKFVQSTDQLTKLQ
jgi:Type III secretion basal body protein I, YscI, HrpB, PscI